ncbi:MAG TPA: glycosyltransferase family 39 protein [Tepidisphaeraceae bacterium]|nr:glycosyltransferase family 39 protein [Tepidisphaeraceae bacterium]
MTQTALPLAASPSPLSLMNPIAPAAAQQELPAWLGRLGRSPRVIVALACLLLLVPFLSKPLHIDDPMYVWAAEQIRQNPLDPYGFAVNWQAELVPMAHEMKNPPLVCYYLAAAMGVLGTGEAALHAAMLLPALGLVLGTYQLAKELGVRPLLAAGATLATPVFLLSAASIMSDIPMVCAYVWAAWFWVAGTRWARPWMLWVAALLVAASTLTKYFGITLFPLLIAYSLVRTRRPGAWLLPLLLPAAILAAYQLWTRRLYGQGLLFDAAGYATGMRWNDGPVAILRPILTGLSFTGGCCASVALLAAPRAGRGVLLAAAGVALLIGIGVIALNPYAEYLVVNDAPGGRPRVGYAAQIALWATLGLGVMALAAGELWRAWRRVDAESALLGLWIVGTFCFAVFVNWNVAGRSILPMAPAAAIVAARAWSRRDESRAASEDPSIEAARERSCEPCRAGWVPWVAIAPALVVAVVVTYADARLAVTARDAANEIHEGLAESKPKVYFCGHWGFQQYMQQWGYQPFDKYVTNLDPGDVYVVPENTSRRIALPPGSTETLAIVRHRPARWVSTMGEKIGAGFYSEFWGPLPFAFGKVPSEKYTVQLVKAKLHH